MSADVHTLAGAYVLDAVDDVERAAFERHLAECEPCRVEVAELRETVARLADDTVIEATPPGLRERTLAQAARTPQLRVEGAGASGGRQAGRWRRLTVAAAAAVLVAGGASAVTWTVSNDRISDEQASSEQARQIAAVLDAPDARVFERSLPPGGAATVVVSRDRDRGVVLLRDLPAPGAGRIYELWLIRGSEPRKVGQLAEGDRASTTVIGPVGEAGTFGVSNEPVGGSVAPTLIVGTVGLS
ncbi:MULTISPECIES: anti-sigma factor [Micromonospora]|uniref:anti-sigma factor n=1 Tax=Micromonospora TaxID=1873 RepID=UPI001EE795F4|nr:MULTISPECIES: anti-sigma factor [Micromonospora]MCG5449601.1 anti-sigma factor [Micromonospora hortensis]MCX5115600.1 anti-sigma factor [Micromonospora sp. NBC_00362]WTI06073.1 anti-sigma factor [Micromonospora sp. NBC_00821]